MADNSMMAKMLMGGSVPMPRPDPRGLVPMPQPDPRYNLRASANGTMWPPPPVPYDGYQPQPLTAEQQKWLDAGLPPPPSLDYGRQ